MVIIDQQNNVKLFVKYKFEFKFIIDTIKFIDLKIDEIPLIWRDKIIKFVAIILWYEIGGYKVHPDAIFWLVNILIDINIKDGINNQNLKLFIRGKIKSLEKIISGINQFLNLPMIMGIVIKKIIIKAWIVINI